jgi:hypothetical protein
MTSPALIDALRRLNPALEPDDDTYTARDPEGEGAPWNQPARLQLLLDAGYQVHATVTGAIGSGKSTELRRWARALGDRAAYVEVDLHSSGVLSDVRWMDAVTPEHDAPVVIIDGLDRADQAERLFPLTFQDPRVSIVAAGPPELLTAARQLWHPAPFPVRAPGALTPRRSTCSALADGLRRRIGVAELIRDDGLLERIAYLSGGLPRTMVNLTRQALLLGRDGVIDPRSVALAEREVRQDLEDSVHATTSLLVDFINPTRKRPPNFMLTSGAVLCSEGPTAREYVLHPLLYAVMGKQDLIEEALHALR